MTRKEMIQYLYNRLYECKNWWEVRNVINECIDWNMEHEEGCEIFMCEGEDNTVSIEDDYVSFDF